MYLRHQDLPRFLQEQDTGRNGNNIEARCKVSPKWDSEADKEIKLERIITQKWIAMFPEGCEAWAEQRRTGQISDEVIKGASVVCVTVSFDNPA